MKEEQLKKELSRTVRAYLHMAEQLGNEQSRTVRGILHLSARWADGTDIVPFATWWNQLEEKRADNYRNYEKGQKLLDKLESGPSGRLWSEAGLFLELHGIGEPERQNREYLQVQLRTLGFGDHLKEVLDVETRKGTERFALRFPHERQGKMAVYTLDFSRSERSGMYSFNSYRLEMGGLSHTFPVNGTKGVAAMEAINVFEGRAVRALAGFGETGERDVFVQVDSDMAGGRERSGALRVKYYEDHGMDTVAVLENAPVTVRENPIFDAVIKLEKGCLLKIGLPMPGGEEEGFAALNPRHKSLDLYDKDMNRIGHGEIAALERERERQRSGAGGRDENGEPWERKQKR